MLRRRRRRQAEGNAGVFLGARPVPTRVAGYAPVPLETGRAPKGALLEVPPANSVGTVYPSPRPVVLPPGGGGLILPTPVIVGPGVTVTPPPCPDVNKDGECDKPDEPPKPPVDVPEPQIWAILIAGALALWFGLSTPRRSRR